MSPAEIALVVATVGIISITGLAVSDLVALRWGTITGGPERALGAVVGCCLFASALMVAHVVTRGAVFGSPAVVPLAAVTVIVLHLRARGRARLPPMRPTATTVAVGAALFLLYVVPLLLEGPGTRTGDPPWHLGWTEQLLAGEAVPQGPAPEPYAHNAYPWGLHAFLAVATRLVPGADPIVALDALHILLVAAIPLAAACLARAVEVRAGEWAAGCAGLIGGFGWLQARGADFVFSPARARYGADLVVASPNSVYELFPPGLPRELGLVLLAAVGVALIRRRFGPAGVAAGLAGLVSVPMFVAALVWIAAGAIAHRHLRGGAAAAGTSLAIFTLWAGPVVFNAVAHGGFVDITPKLGREWPLALSLSSWGVLLPLAAVGLSLLFLRRRDATVRVVIGIAAGSASLLLLALLRGVNDWALAGNATLLHQGRVWPHTHLLAAVLAGIALARVWPRLRSRAIAWPAAVLLIVAGVGSPALAAVAFTRQLEDGGSGFVYGGDDLGTGSFARRAAAHLGPDTVLDVGATPLLGFTLWQLSGCRLTGYDDPALPGNDLRIRYRDLSAAWERRGRSIPGDFALVIGSDSDAVVTGSFRGQIWSLVPGPGPRSGDEPG